MKRPVNFFLMVALGVVVAISCANPDANTTAPVNSTPTPIPAAEPTPTFDALSVSDFAKSEVLEQTRKEVRDYRELYLDILALALKDRGAASDRAAEILRFRIELRGSGSIMVVNHDTERFLQARIEVLKKHFGKIPGKSKEFLDFVENTARYYPNLEKHYNAFSGNRFLACGDLAELGYLDRKKLASWIDSRLNDKSVRYAYVEVLLGLVLYRNELEKAYLSSADVTKVPLPDAVRGLLELNRKGTYFTPPLQFTLAEISVLLNKDR